MKTKVIYYTKTGHSKKIANAIAKSLDITAQDIKQNKVIDETDLLFIVGGIYANDSMPEMKDYVKKLDYSKVKKVVLVTSCTTNKTPQTNIRKILEENKIEVSNDEFICKGSFLFFGIGHPNKEDINNAVEFAKKHVN